MDRGYGKSGTNLLSLIRMASQNTTKLSIHVFYTLLILAKYYPPPLRTPPPGASMKKQHHTEKSTGECMKKKILRKLRARCLRIIACDWPRSPSGGVTGRFAPISDRPCTNE